VIPMDALFHFAMSFAGGYIVLKGLKADFRLWELFLLSIIAGLIDIDHITGLRPEVLIFHNLAFAVGVPLVLIMIFRHYKKPKLQAFSLAAMVMLIGHLLADMITGMYGVPLLFPLYGGLFMIPQSWNFIEIDHSYVIAPAGIAVAAYFAIVFSVALMFKNEKIRSCFSSRP
jgi:hypothetical protein